MPDEPREISKLRIGQAVRNIKDAVARLAISTLANALDAIASRLLAAENKLSGIAAGAQVNVIESVKVNGAALPVQSKAVDVPVPNQAATTTDPGLMSAADKAKLDGIATGATKVDVDSALSSQSTNPVQNKVIDTALGGKADTGHTHDDRYYTESEVDTALSGKVSKAGDTMSGDLTIEAFVNAAFGNVPTNVCDIDGDLNNATMPGLYMYLSTHDNRPTSTSVGGALLVVRYNQNMISQLAFCNSQSSSALVYARHYYQGTWGAWHRIAVNNMTADLTINGYINAALGNVPATVCDINGDLNNAIEPGLYRYIDTYTNRPGDGGGVLLVTKYSENYISQLAFGYSLTSSAVIYERHYQRGTWGSWGQIAFNNMTAELTINNKINASLGNVPAAVCNIGTDLNNAVEPGLYQYISSYDNKPSGTGGVLVVLQYNANYISQLAFCNSPSNSAVIYDRFYYLGTWGPWHRIAVNNMTADLTINGHVNAALGDVPTDVCDIDGDLNNANVPGIYSYVSGTANTPNNSGGSLLALRNFNNNIWSQIAFTNTSGKTVRFYARHYYSDGWGSWVQMATTITGTWTPHLYDYDTLVRSLSTSSYMRIGDFVVAYIYISNPNLSGISTMLQIRNLPMTTVWGGSVYLSALQQSSLTRPIYIQPADGRIYLRPNVKSSEFSNPTSGSGVFSITVFGKA